MKKITNLLLIIFSAIALCSCSPKSAYDIAVENGFVGSETEWLESLKGKDGTSFNNTSIINITSIDIEDGKRYTIYYSDSSSYSFDVLNGQSAYQVAVSKGFSGTEEEWLDSLNVINNINNYDIDITSNDGVLSGVNKALMSTVAIVCKNSSDATTGSSGSGVFIQLDKSTGVGYIITNYHVVYMEDTSSIANYIATYLYGQEVASKAMEATYIGGSMNYDIAVIKVENANLKSSFATAATLNYDLLDVGSTTIAVGNPEGSGVSASIGVLNVNSEYINLVGADNKTTIELRVMRTDAAVNPGNSGGGLFDKNGNLIGIVNAKSVSSDTDNIGYAIPLYNAISCYHNILDIAAKDDSKDGIYKPLLGITIQISDKDSSYDEINDKFILSQTISVITVGDTSISKNIIYVNDIIHSVKCLRNEEEVFSIDINYIYNLTECLLNVRANDNLVINLDRNNVNMDVEITIPESSINLFI